MYFVALLISTNATKQKPSGKPRRSAQYKGKYVSSIREVTSIHVMVT